MAAKQKKLSPQEIQYAESIRMMGMMANEAYLKIYGADKVEEWRSACMEQASNFLLAGVVLQRKQWEIAAKCRECDLPNGPKQILAGGGRGSAKSHGILAQIFCDDCQRVKGLKVLCLRKVGRANKEQIQDFRKKLLINLPHNYREQAQTIEFDNGSIVILGNYKDEKDIEKYLGLEYDLIYVMECNQLTRTKIINIESCLRTNKTNWRPRLYLDTNPGGISHVEHKRIFVEPWKNKKETDTRYIHSTVDDNKFVDSGYKLYLEKLVGWQREAWLHGSWEFMAGAFFNNFYADIHVYPNEQTNLNPRAITRWFGGLDYGFSHPNAFVLGCEDESGNVFIPAIYSASSTLIEEHAANIKDVISLFGLNIEELEFIAAGADCFRVGKDGSTVATEYQERGIMLTAVHIDRINAWSQVAEVFGDIQHQIKPRCFIHKNCQDLVVQIQAAQCDPKKPNDILKMNADENGDGGDDLLDACLVGETLVITNRGGVPIKKVIEGDFVLTSCGFKKVLVSGMTNKSAKVFKVKLSNGSEITGTANHPIWTESGWKTIDSLRNGDIVSVCLNPKQSYSTEGHSEDTHNQNDDTSEATTLQVKLNRLEKAFRSIRKFTSRITRSIKSSRVFTSTIETETRSIIKLKIWNANWAQAISATMFPLFQFQSNAQEWITPESLQSLGTKQKNAATSQNETGKLRSESVLSKENTPVNFAVKGSFQNRHSHQSFATSIARSRSKEEILGTLKIESARSAEYRLKHSSGVKPKLAPESVVELNAVGQSEVFNLEVEDCPEYFANGVLVHNCRNMIVMAYSSLISSAKPIQMGNYKSLNENVEEEFIDVEAVIEESERQDLENNSLAI